MKSIKLLLISFTMTFITLMTISPAIAKPSAKVQELQLNSALTTAFGSYNIVKAVSKAPNTISMPFKNNFSTGLILSSPVVLSEGNAHVAMTVVNKSNEFFASAMIVSDKLNQFISYFNTPTKKVYTEQATPENKVLKEKCSNTINFS